MSNPNREFNNPWEKTKGGNRSGNFSKRKSYNNEQRNHQGGSRQVSSSESNEASGTQSTSFVNEPKTYASENNSRRSNKHNANQEQRNSQKGNRNEVRAFSMGASNNTEIEIDRKSSVKDSICQRVKNSINFHQNIGKVESKAEDTKKVSDSLSSQLQLVQSESEAFECIQDSTDLNETSESNSTDGSSRGKSCVTEVEGDLFAAPNDVSLAHCVGADFRMGSGIAVRFMKQFKSLGKLFDQRKGPGEVAYIKDHRRVIFYLITKQASTEKPTNDTMRTSLLALLEKCKELRVTKLAMPQIGCGQDGLSWNRVKQMLEEIFADDFLITIYKLDRGFVDKPTPGSKSRVKNENLFLKDIQPGTGLLYIGCAELFESDEMKSLNEEYSFLTHLYRPQKGYKLGSVFKTSIPNSEIVYGLICKKTGNSRLSYEQLEMAIQHLNDINKKDGYEYFGLQAFKEQDDPHVMAKIETLLKNSFLNVEFWICWPPSLIQERNVQSMQVQESNYPSVQDQQSSSSHPSKLMSNSEQFQNTHYLSEVEGSGHQTVRDMEMKKSAQSLPDETILETSMTDPNYSEAKKVASNTSDIEGFDEEGWPTFDGSRLVNNEKRKSREKKEANRLSKQKEKQASKNVNPTSCITECKGDLFDAEDTMCLAHCVGADLRMGSGIAVIFRQKFGSVDILLDQRVRQGGVAYIEHGKRYIFYLVTKNESTGKPTYNTLEKSLVALHTKCKELKVTELAMPRIGCGLDRLEWGAVKSMIEKIFADGFTIQIYNLQKDYQETKQSIPKTTIVKEALLLKDIEQKTGLIYIGTVQPFISEEMKSLDAKYNFLMRLDKAKPKLGTVVRTEAPYPREKIYGLICKQSANDRISYVHLKAAIGELKKIIHKTDRYDYLGIQAFKERDDDNVMGKIETMFRYSYIEAQLWICFPPSLTHLMPSPTYNPSRFGGERVPWNETDNHRLAATLRDTQRMVESIYQKLNILEDKAKVSGSDGWKEVSNQMISKMDKFERLMDEISFKMDNFIQESHCFDETYQQLPQRVAALEETVEVLSHQLRHSVSAGQGHGYYSNGGHSRSRFSNGPPPLLHDTVGRQVCPSPMVFYDERMQFPHYPNHPVYATEYLPEEKQALIRATNETAERLGYAKVFEKDGRIYVQKAERSKIVAICNYQDLSLL